jgi:hypothetical protein
MGLDPVACTANSSRIVGPKLQACLPAAKARRSGPPARAASVRADRTHRPQPQPGQDQRRGRGDRVRAAADPSGVGPAAAWLGAGTHTGGAEAVAGDDLADPGLQRAGRPQRRRRRRDYRSWEREAPMSLWQMDIMGGAGWRTAPSASWSRGSTTTPLLRGGPPGGPGDRPAGVPGAGGRLAGLEAAVGGPDRHSS